MRPAWAKLIFFNGLLWQLDSESQLNVLQSLYTSNGAELRVMLEKGGAVSRWTPDRQKDQAKRTDKPKTVVKVPGGQGVITGTEYSIRVDENGRTALLVLEGEVELSADSGATIHVGENESAEMRPGSPALEERHIECTRSRAVGDGLCGYATTIRGECLCSDESYSRGRWNHGCRRAD